MSTPRIEKLVLVFDNGHAFNVEASVDTESEEDEDTLYPDLLQARDQERKIEYTLTLKIF